MDKAWVLSLRDQCRAAQVPFFFKQWGGLRKSKAGRRLDGTTYDEFPRCVELLLLDLGRRQAGLSEIAGLLPPAAVAN